MAVTLRAGQMAKVVQGDGEATMPDTEAIRLHAVACEIVDRYAAGAPTAIANEAACRVAAYLLADDPAVRSLRRIRVGEVEIEPRAVGSALRLSGAMALLGPFRIRRAS